MPVLPNNKHELFAQGLAKGLSADAAYQAAGYKRDRGNAARLMQPMPDPRQTLGARSGRGWRGCTSAAAGRRRRVGLTPPSRSLARRARTPLW
jgi:hypothetical protein